MKALVYHGPGKKSWEEAPKPVIIEPTDVIIKILKTTICGTDLHIIKGDVPTVAEGRIIGHEGVGVIEEVGAEVRKFRKGAHVIISCITSCGFCEYCKKTMFSHCVNGGWLLGNKIDGTQAEYVRIPYADTSLYPIPEHADEEALVMLSDILPTGFECGVLNGRIKVGDTIAIVGAGPIGLAVLLTAQFFAPSVIIMIDHDANRLKIAKTFGAGFIINNFREDARSVVMNLTKGKGVDVAVEAVGIPSTFELCESLIGVCGRIANIGVHAECAHLHLETLWSQNITITTGLVDTTSTAMLEKNVIANNINANKLITHHFKLDEIIQAYDTFEHAEKDNALKVILTA